MTRSKVLLGAVLVALLCAGGTGAALAATGARVEQAPAPTPQALGPTTTHDLEFVPVEPCRLADTRQSGGIVANNTGRNFLVKGSTGIEAQGGNAGGCGVPEGALAAELTIISASASGPGLLRAYPFGGVPTATILAYQSGANLLNTGTLALCDGDCDSDLTVRSYQANTHVIIDVNGYYVPNRFAVINADGSVASGSRVVSAAEGLTGVYEVTFEDDLTGCAAIASGSDDGNQVDLWARVSTDDPHIVELDVEDPDEANTQTSNGFFVHVIC